VTGEIRVGLKEALIGVVVIAGAVLVYSQIDLPPGALLTAPFVLIGTLVLYLSVKKLQRSSQRDEFVPVEATVLRSDLRVEEEVDRGSKTTTYFPEVEYDYTVDGDTYTSDSVYPGRVGGTSNRSDNQSVVDDHPPGAEVEAYYHPEDPSRSFLVDKSSTRAALFGILAGLGLAGVGLYGFWVTLG
jgi:hypothetical protein